MHLQAVASRKMASITETQMDGLRGWSNPRLDRELQMQFARTPTGPGSRRRLLGVVAVAGILVVGILTLWVTGVLQNELSETSCPARATHNPGTEDELRATLLEAEPGDVIRLAPRATFRGKFVIEVEATEEAPVWVCGDESVLQGASNQSGSVLTIRKSAWVRVTGVVVESGTRGVVFDQSNHVSFTDGIVRKPGQEAVHIMRNTTDSVVARNTIEDTGRRRPEWGEGVYVGTSPSNWKRLTANRADHSDGNRIEGNQFWRTSAECVDAKTGTRDGVVEDNSCDLSRIGRFDIDQYTTRNGIVIRGSGWRVTRNELVWVEPENDDGFIRDGIRVHVGKGRGEDNVISGNILGGTTIRADEDYGNWVSDNAR